MRKQTYVNLLIITIVICLLTAWNKPLPNLFLIGDSISIQYGPYLEKYLKNVVIFERKQDGGQAAKDFDVPTGANGGDSRMVLAYLIEKIKDPTFSPDYLVLNCGLHDIKRNPLTKTIQVSEQEYRKNLEEIVKLLSRQKIKLIWIRTTAVVDSIHNAKQKSFHRFSSDLQKYNQIADEVCSSNKIPVIDLFSFTKKLGIEQFVDHVHYKEQARNLQAAFIAGNISMFLNELSKSKSY